MNVVPPCVPIGITNKLKTYFTVKVPDKQSFVNKYSIFRKDVINIHEYIHTYSV